MVTHVLVSVIIDFGSVASSRARLYLGPNQSVSFSTCWDLPAGGLWSRISVCVCLSWIESERGTEKERKQDRRRGSLKGLRGWLCRTERPSGKQMNLPSQFQCPGLSLTGHCQGDLLSCNTHLNRYTHMHRKRSCPRMLNYHKKRLHYFFFLYWCQGDSCHAFTQACRNITTVVEHGKKCHLLCFRWYITKFLQEMTCTNEPATTAS